MSGAALGNRAPFLLSSFPPFDPPFLLSFFPPSFYSFSFSPLPSSLNSSLRPATLLLYFFSLPLLPPPSLLPFFLSFPLFRTLLPSTLSSLTSLIPRPFPPSPSTLPSSPFPPLLSLPQCSLVLDGDGWYSVLYGSKHHHQSQGDCRADWVSPIPHCCIPVHLSCDLFHSMKFSDPIQLCCQKVLSAFIC